MTTQFANAQYQEIIDLHTESKKVSVVGIHTPASQTPMKMLSGFWSQFKKFKYNGCNIALVPVAQLPADPLQVSYDGGETQIDPRDLTNPILFKGCHGEYLNEILNSLYTSTVGSDEVSRQFGDSVDHNMFNRDAVGGSELYESMYYRALTDNTWAKAHPMRGFRKNGLHPMMYMVGTTHQMSNHPYDTGGAVTPYIRRPDDVFGEFDDSVSPVTAGDMGMPGSQSSNVSVGRPPAVPTFDTSSLKMKFGLNGTNLGFYTPRLARLGWMDTYNVMQPTSPLTIESEALTGDAKGDAQKIMSMYQSRRVQNGVPKLFMGMIMFAPAYKTELHYRLIITHSFSFKGFQGASSFADLYTGNYQNMTATEPTKGVDDGITDDDFDRSD